MSEHSLSPHPPSKPLSIGQLSKRCAVNIETIRYYERIGLLPEPPRSAGGYRQYAPAHMARLGFIRRGRQLGFSLDDIRELLALDQRQVSDQGDPCLDAQQIAARHIAALDEKVADLQRLRVALADIEHGCRHNRQQNSEGACPLIDSLRSASG